MGSGVTSLTVKPSLLSQVSSALAVAGSTVSRFHLVRRDHVIRELLAREGHDVAVTRGSTYENRAKLAPGFFDQIVRKYEGTWLGRQELNAELVEDTAGALWTHAMIDAARLATARQLHTWRESWLRSIQR
jgi:phage terminase large subunit-like protein